MASGFEYSAVAIERAQNPALVASGDAAMPFTGVRTEESIGSAFAEIIRAVLAHQEQKSVATAAAHQE